MRFLAMLISCVLSAPAFGNCTLPPAPSKIPDGATGSEPKMLSAMQTLKRYNTDVTNYTKCLQFERNQGRLREDEQTRLHNSAIDGLKATAEQFNE